MRDVSVISHCARILHHAVCADRKNVLQAPGTVSLTFQHAADISWALFRLVSSLFTPQPQRASPATILPSPPSPTTTGRTHARGKWRTAAKLASPHAPVTHCLHTRLLSALYHLCRWTPCLCSSARHPSCSPTFLFSSICLPFCQWLSRLLFSAFSLFFCSYVSLAADEHSLFDRHLLHWWCD